MSNVLREEFPNLMAAYREQVIREVLKEAERIYLEGDFDDANGIEDTGKFLDQLFIAFGVPPETFLNEYL